MECKGIVAGVGARPLRLSPLVVCANDEQVLSYRPAIASDNHTHYQRFCFSCTQYLQYRRFLSEEARTTLIPRTGSTFTEPNASIMKAGCFDVLEQRFCRASASARILPVRGGRNLLPIFRAGHSPSIHRHHEQEKELKQLLAGHLTPPTSPYAISPNRGPRSCKNQTQGRWQHLPLRYHRTLKAVT